MKNHWFLPQGSRASIVIYLFILDPVARWVFSPSLDPWYLEGFEEGDDELL